MNELNYLMVDQNRMPEAGNRGIRKRVRAERFFWHGSIATVHLAPPGWVGGRRLSAYAQKLADSAGGLWIAPELDACFPNFRQPCPDPGLAAFLLQEQPFREILVLLWEDGDSCCRGAAEWKRRFLEECFDGLNGLYVVGGEASEEEREFYDWLYGQSGLPVCVTAQIPETRGEKTVVVDQAPALRLPVRKLMQSCLYLDLTSDPAKQRILKQKRTDISYISARNYLDTAFKARYNAF